jgi:plasmid stability protein
MADQTLTLTIPDDLYQRFKQHAAFSRRSLEEELLTLATTALVDDEIPADMLETVAALATLDDEALWQAARSSKLAPKHSREIERLQHKRQQTGLIPVKQQRLSKLLHQYRKALLVRAHAVGLLKERGHDVDGLLEEP